MFSAIKTGRSLAASYNLQSDIQRKCSVASCARTRTQYLTVFLRVSSDKEAQLFESQAPTIVSLTKGCKSAKIVRELGDIPAGCGSAVLSPTIVVHVLVRVRLLRQSG